jgi:hypothetical protein
MLVGSPIVGAAAAIAGYSAAFYTAAVTALACAVFSAGFICGSLAERRELPDTLSA